MSYRTPADRTGSAYAELRRTGLRPHLVCSWTLDPVSQRLSCAWAAPSEAWDITFARVMATSRGPRLAVAK